MADAAVGTTTYSGKVSSIIEALKGFTLMDLKELKDAYKETFGVEAAAAMPMGAMMMPGAGAGAADAAPKSEPTIFHLMLKDIGPKKIQVIKVVRELTGLGLKEAKDLVDSAATAPAKIKENMDKKDADEAMKKLEESGAVASLTPA